MTIREKHISRLRKEISELEHRNHARASATFGLYDWTLRELRGFLHLWLLWN